MKNIIIFFAMFVFIMLLQNIIVAQSDVNIHKAQLKLKELGYNPGPIDGRLSTTMSSALKAFQKDNNLPRTGKLDESTAKLLGIKQSTVSKRHRIDPCANKLVLHGNMRFISPDLKIAGNGNWGEDPFRFAGAEIGIQDDIMTVIYNGSKWQWKNSRPNDPIVGIEIVSGKQPTPVHASGDPAKLNAINSAACWAFIKAGN